LGNSVFCYGTLTFPQIMQAITGRTFPHCQATLEGYLCVLIKGAVYPAVVVAEGHHTEGVLYRHVDPSSLRRLDRYEDRPYVRRTLSVRLTDGSEHSAEVYLVPPHKHWMLSSNPWNNKRFAQVHLKNHLMRLKQG
jgi:gamma-glutamylcyclotransferase (GGCT)/AIG2-like uncharacterized protein YtfP